MSLAPVAAAVTRLLLFRPKKFQLTMFDCPLPLDAESPGRNIMPRINLTPRPSAKKRRRESRGNQPGNDHGALQPPKIPFSSFRCRFFSERKQLLTRNCYIRPEFLNKSSRSKRSPTGPRDQRTSRGFADRRRSRGFADRRRSRR